MELTPTQFRAVKKAKILLSLLEGRMDSNEHCLFNEIDSDWGEINFDAINYSYYSGVTTSKTGLIQPGEDIRLV